MTALTTVMLYDASYFNEVQMNTSKTWENIQSMRLQVNVHLSCNSSRVLLHLRKR